VSSNDSQPVFYFFKINPPTFVSWVSPMEPRKLLVISLVFCPNIQTFDTYVRKLLAIALVGCSGLTSGSNKLEKGCQLLVG
jgi:hypothetical protein